VISPPGRPRGYRMWLSVIAPSDIHHEVINIANIVVRLYFTLPGSRQRSDEPVTQRVQRRVRRRLLLDRTDTIGGYGVIRGFFVTSACDTATHTVQFIINVTPIWSGPIACPRGNSCMYSPSGRAESSCLSSCREQAPLLE
jgi:hypothetical protein